MYSRFSFDVYKRITPGELRLLDFALIILGYCLATGIAAIASRFQLFRYPSPDEWSSLPVMLLPITLIAWSIISGHGDIYVSHRDEGLSYLTLKSLRTVALWATVSLGAVFLAKLKYTSRQFTLEFILCGGFLIVFRQMITVLILRELREAGYDQKTALVVGSEANCRRFIAQVNASHPTGYRFISSIVSSDVFPDGDSDLAKADLADEIYIVGTSLDLESPRSAAVRFLRQGKSVHIVPEVIDAALFRQTLGEVGGIPVLSVSCGRLTKVESFAKRAVDITCGLIVLVLCSPIMLATAVLVKLTSSGSVFFYQRRLGKGGNLFTLIKFRTMRCDAEYQLTRSPELHQKYLSNNYKLPAKEDPRLTSIGGFLRALSIDELPQIINVLKGEMSLVGPRPILAAEIEKYGDFGSLFLSVKPGMTGNWQVSGRSEIKEYEQRVELDLEYIRDQSMRTDFGILLRTVPVVLKRTGAH